MTMLPTRRDEAWRYSDLDAVATLWPVPPAEVITLEPGEVRDVTLFAEDGVRDFAITLGAGAKLSWRLLITAQRYSRVAMDVTLHEGSDFYLGAVQLGSANQTVEIVTTVRHVEPNATSQQVVRSVLGGSATGSYLGKVAVARGADGTDSVQSVRAMLLDRTATANAKPELEIYADDVKCAHGAAIGELDANGLFYLMARGLLPADAKRLMLQAFVAEVFEGADAALGEAALAALGRLV